MSIASSSGVELLRLSSRFARLERDHATTEVKHLHSPGAKFHSSFEADILNFWDRPRTFVPTMEWEGVSLWVELDSPWYFNARYRYFYDGSEPSKLQTDRMFPGPISTTGTSGVHMHTSTGRVHQPAPFPLDPGESRVLKMMYEVEVDDSIAASRAGWVKYPARMRAVEQMHLNVLVL